ncbi:toxin-antitoxin system YwqK family antitoxin, partial [Salinimicrobium sp. CDJ15-91]|nr:toxin-antitoxin system YwqK family antitoxin [Salinimicrobium oceani]
KGVVLEDLLYKNGELHGSASFYNGKGELMSEGEYRHNKHHGTWRYYENGKLVREKDFK